MREKRFSVAGFEFGVATDEERLERLRNSALYQKVVKPGLNKLGGGHNGNGHAPPASEPLPPEHRTYSDPEAQAMWEKVSKIGWYHTIDVGRGVATPGFIDNRPTMHRFGLPEDLTGKRCLDIGTYDGFWAFEMERRGASEVIGIDVDSPADHDLPRLAKLQVLKETEGEEERIREHWNNGASSVGLQWPGEGFRVAKELLGSKARREVLSVYDLSPEKLGMFDVVLISQLLLRLRDPQTVLENMFSVTREMAIVGEPYNQNLERLTVPASEFLGTAVVGAWWSHSIKAMKRIMEVAGFNPVEEVSRFEVHNRAGRFPKVILKGHVQPGAHEAG
jgi:tRNA (mo5U34)-methyltransferase